MAREWPESSFPRFENKADTAGPAAIRRWAVPLRVYVFRSETEAIATQCFAEGPLNECGRRCDINARDRFVRG
jgi:hypothetical protein